MRTLFLIVLFTLLLISRVTHAQTQEAAQLILNYEKLNQLKKVLQNMYDGYKIITTGYNKVRDVTSGNYKLHQIFLDGLMQVSPRVRDYARIADIIRYQTTMVKEYKAAYQQFRSAGVFNSDELNYFSGVYSNLLDRSLRNLEELSMVITSSKLRMSDDERLSAIDRLYLDMEEKVLFLRHFNSKNSILSRQLLMERSSNKTLLQLHQQ